MQAAVLGAGALALSLVCAASAANAQSTPEARDWLRKIYRATQTLSYTGTFVYQHDRRSETSRIARRADVNGSVERLEVLDGEPREIVRTSDGISCYLPRTRTLKVDRHGTARAFPSMLPEQLDELLQHYRLRLGTTDRVAGRPCQTIRLEPRDVLRYGHELCADVASGMLLRAIALDEAGAPVERFTFTELVIGEVAAEAVVPRYATGSWKIEEVSVQPTNLEATGWRVEADLPGFQKVVEVRRILHTRQRVGQLVYSDGIAAVSVFIEPSASQREPIAPGAATVGGVNIYVREVGDHVVTVVGETPAVSVRRIAERVRYLPPQ